MSKRFPRPLGLTEIRRHLLRRRSCRVGAASVNAAGHFLQEVLPALADAR